MVYAVKDSVSNLDSSGSVKSYEIAWISREIIKIPRQVFRRKKKKSTQEEENKLMTFACKSNLLLSSRKQKPR